MKRVFVFGQFEDKKLMSLLQKTNGNKYNIIKWCSVYDCIRNLNLKPDIIIEGSYSIEEKDVVSRLITYLNLHRKGSLYLILN